MTTAHMKVRNGIWLRRAYHQARSRAFSFSPVRRLGSLFSSAPPASFSAAACTSIGQVRRNNQDAFGYNRSVQTFLVCDGMGGAAGGDLASRLAVETVLDTMLDGERVLHSIAAQNDQAQQWAREEMEAAIDAANHAIYERSQKHAGLCGMGTTLVMLRLAGRLAHLAHVGDSRAYLFRKAELQRLTLDHSLVEEQLRLGLICPEQAQRAPYRNMITRALGTESTVAADYTEVALLPGDLLLLVTDGLTNELDDAVLAGLLRAATAQPVEGQSRSAEEAALKGLCSTLVEAANRHGGRDNITCLLVRIA